ncbi:MAG TPA: restriction endonuclease [Gemmatimonadales bacterium]|nr:restriction endonuclease [Gemmatimonadales bacterium]
MATPPDITPDYFQILAVRELRKVGFDVGAARIHRRSELAEPQHGFVLELVAPLAASGWHRLTLVACRREDGAVTREVIESLAGRLGDAGADAAIVFSTADFGAEAVAAAQDRNVALLRVVDSHTAYDASGWGGTPGHYPAWLPAHTAELIVRDAAGQVRTAALEPGRVETIVDQLDRDSNRGA